MVAIDSGTLMTSGIIPPGVLSLISYPITDEEINQLQDDGEMEGEWDLRTRDDRLQRLALEVRIQNSPQNESLRYHIPVSSCLFFLWSGLQYR